jgi:hypothetical protein
MHILYLLYRIIIMYGCETCSPTLREGHRMGVLENRVLMKISGPKMRKWQARETYTVNSFEYC